MYHQPSDKAVASRIKGQVAITKSLQLLLIRVHRYARHRATSEAQRAWASGVLAGLQEALAVPTTGEGAYLRRPAHKSDRAARDAEAAAALSAK